MELIDEDTQIVYGIIEDIYNNQARPVSHKDILFELLGFKTGHPFSKERFYEEFNFVTKSIIKLLKEKLIKRVRGGYIPYDEVAFEIQMGMPEVEPLERFRWEETIEGGRYYPEEVTKEEMETQEHRPIVQYEPSEGPWRKLYRSL